MVACDLKLLTVPTNSDIHNYLLHNQLNPASCNCVYRAFCILVLHIDNKFTIYKACSKKDRTFATKTSFYNILSTVPFKVVPSTGDTSFPTFLPLLECFLERTFCDGAQFSYRIFLNLRVFKKKDRTF